MLQLRMTFQGRGWSPSYESQSLDIRLLPANLFVSLEGRYPSGLQPCRIVVSRNLHATHQTLASSARPNWAILEIGLLVLAECKGPCPTEFGALLFDAA